MPCGSGEGKGESAGRQVISATEITEFVSNSAAQNRIGTSTSGSTTAVSAGMPARSGAASCASSGKVR